MKPDIISPDIEPINPEQPGDRPARHRLFLEAEWRYVAMLNYRIDPVLLEPFIPPGTTLDLFEGSAFVSVVAFLFLRTRVLGIRFRSIVTSKR